MENRQDIRVKVERDGGDTFEFKTKHSMSDRQIQILLKGGIINEFKAKLSNEEVGGEDSEGVFE